MKTITPSGGDDYTALQAAIDSFEPVTVTGMCESSKALVVSRHDQSGAGLMGYGSQGKKACGITFTDPEDCGVKCVGDDDVDGSVHFYRLVDLALIGPGATETDIAHGLHIASNHATAHFASGGLVVDGCRFAEWSGCGIYAPETFLSRVDDNVVEHCGQHGIIIGGAPNLLMRRNTVRFLKGGNLDSEQQSIGIWLQAGKPLLEGNSIGGDADKGIPEIALQVGRSKNDPYFSGTPYYNFGAYCWPYLLDTQIEPVSDTAMLFAPTSYPSMIQGSRMYAAAGVQVNDGIHFQWAVPRVGAAVVPFSEIRGVEFLVQSGGSWKKKIRVAGQTEFALSTANGEQDGATTPQDYLDVDDTDEAKVGESAYVYTTGAGKKGPFTINSITAGSKLHFATACIDFLVEDGSVVKGEGKKRGAIVYYGDMDDVASDATTQWWVRDGVAAHA